jgi:hypothetical protein
MTTDDFVTVEDPRFEAARTLLQRIDDSIARGVDPSPVVGFIAGGLCAHRHGSQRPSNEVDGFFHAKVLLPPNLETPFVDGDGTTRTMSWDRVYFRDIGLMHPDYASRAEPFWKGRLLTINMLGPDDLAVSKIGRWAESDREDVAAMAAHGKLEPSRVQRLAEEALGYFVGDPSPVLYNLNQALQVIRDNMPSADLRVAGAALDEINQAAQFFPEQAGRHPLAVGVDPKNKAALAVQLNRLDTGELRQRLDDTSAVWRHFKAAPQTSNFNCRALAAAAAGHAAIVGVLRSRGVDSPPLEPPRPSRRERAPRGQRAPRGRGD